METLAGGQLLYYGYDAAGQLTSETRPSIGSYWYGNGYTYDNAGNRLTKNTVLPTGTTTESYTYDAANELLSAGTVANGVPTSKSYTYDAAGDTKTVTTGASVSTLSWDAAGRLTGITYPNGSTNAFAYNGLSQRVGKSDSVGNFSYMLAGDSIDATPLSDGAATYRQGAGLIGETRGGSKSYYNADGLGSTRAVTDGGGNVSATRETDAFGNVWAPGTTGAMATPFGFAAQSGYQSDADSGLMKLGYRYYDASTGRFLSRDPIRAGQNWYTYCKNDPVNAVDPDGLADTKPKPLIDKWKLAIIIALGLLPAPSIRDVIETFPDIPPGASSPISGEKGNTDKPGGGKKNDSGSGDGPDPRIVDTGVGIGVGVCVGWALWEGVKWTAAILAAGPTGGLSIGGALATP